MKNSEETEENVGESGDSLQDNGQRQDASSSLPWSWSGLKAKQQEDRDISVMLELMQSSEVKPPWEAVALSSHNVKTFWAQWPRLVVKEGLLKRRFESADGKRVWWQVVMPASLRAEFIQIAHGGMTGGHFGRRRTAAAIQARAYWPSWMSDIQNFIRQCTPCARYHRGAIPRRIGLQPTLVGEPWERISVDITGPHPRSSRQNQYILTCVDHFSKWAEAVPLTNHTAVTVARALMTHVFSRFGAPLQLLTDRGSEFQSELFSQLMKWMEIDKLRTTAYQPSTNGAVERFHRTLNTMLGKVVSDSQRDWDDKLPAVMAAYRASPHEATGYSPNRLFLGREVRMPLDLVMGLPSHESQQDRSIDEFVQKTQEQMADAYDAARRHLGVAAQRRKDAYDIRVQQHDLKVGDWVWYWYPRKYTSRSLKWQKSYVGPYLIVREIEPVNFVLQRSKRAKPFVVHVNKLKKCHGSTPVSWLGSEHENDGIEGQGDTSIDPVDVTEVSGPPMEDGGSDGGVAETPILPPRRRRRPQHLADYVCD